MPTEIGDSILHAKQLLEQGQLIGLPTETVYGLAANALNQEAVARIFEVKQRPTFNPIIIHIGRVEDLEKYVISVPTKARNLIEKFWPGPLTLLLPKKAIIPDLITAGSPLVAVRMPAHPMALALLQSLSFPLAAPSANPFMYVSPTTAQHVAKQLGKSIPYILEGGPSTVGVESTIVSFENEPPTILRHGGVTKEAIEEVIGPLNIQTKLVESVSEKLDSPGQYKKHYSANKPTQRLPNIPAEWWASPTSIGFLGFDKPLNLAVGPESSKVAALVPSKNQFILSPKADLNVAAALLFGTLRLLDEHPAIKYIILDNFPQSGLGLAINDRLSRAVNI